jgi:hypothetical protein
VHFHLILYDGGAYAWVGRGGALESLAVAIPTRCVTPHARLQARRTRSLTCEATWRCSALQTRAHANASTCKRASSRSDKHSALPNTCNSPSYTINMPPTHPPTHTPHTAANISPRGSAGSTPCHLPCLFSAGARATQTAPWPSGYRRRRACRCLCHATSQPTHQASSSRSRSASSASSSGDGEQARPVRAFTCR